MTTGYSGSFAVNGISLSLQPSESRWIGRDSLGIDASGRPVYPAVRSYELTWGLMTSVELAQLINFQNSVGTTGTAVVDIPQWNAVGYLFQSYSGTILHEPEVGVFFNTYYTDVKLLITNIRT